MLKYELKAARMLLNLTQEQMANFLNTKIRKYQGWKTRHKTPPAALVAVEILEEMDEKQRDFWINKKRT